MDGWVDGRMDGCIKHGKMVGRMARRMDSLSGGGRTCTFFGGWMDDWMDGWMDGWMDARVDGLILSLVLG